MPYTNKVTLLGHAGDKAEIKYIKEKAVINFSLVTKYKDETEWTRVVAWGGWAENANIEKGNLVYVEGRLRTRSWEKDGIKRYVTEIIASVLYNLDNRKKH